MGAFIGVDGFKVHHVADHVEVLTDPVATMHVAGMAGDLKGLAAIVPFDQADHLGRGAGFVHQATHAQRGLQAQRDLGLHVGKLQLEQLCLRQWTAELFAVKPILPGRVPARLGSAHRPQAMP